LKDADDEFDDISQKDDGYIKLVLRVLARMCDGQHAGLQASTILMYQLVTVICNLYPQPSAHGPKIK